jgi:HEAT repeat protein
MKNNSGIEYADIVLAVDNFEREDAATFLNSLRSPNPYIVWHGIKGCGLKMLRAAVPQIVEILGKPCEPLGHSGNSDLRKIAAWSLGKMGYDSFAEYLTDIEHNPNVLLREGLADALGMTSDPRAIPVLDRLMADEDRNVVLWGALALAKLGEASIPIIDRHLRAAKDLARAAYLSDALKKIGTAQASGILKTYLHETPFRELEGILSQ